jgi:hypothetical protein
MMMTFGRTDVRLAWIATRAEPITNACSGGASANTISSVRRQ